MYKGNEISFATITTTPTTGIFNFVFFLTCLDDDDDDNSNDDDNDDDDENDAWVTNKSNIHIDKDATCMLTS